VDNTTIQNWIKRAVPTGPIELDEAIIKCNGYCSSYTNSGLDRYKENFCNEEFDIDANHDGDFSANFYFGRDNIFSSSLDCHGIGDSSIKQLAAITGFLLPEGSQSSEA